MLVVAKYQEDMAWTRKYSQRLVIYNKGSRDTIPDDLLQFVVDLPNVGREAHTFLWHIVHNYDNLDEILVFVQGRCNDHLNKGWTVEDLFTLDGKMCSSNLVDSTLWGSYASTYDFRIPQWSGTRLAPTSHNETYGQWYERMFGTLFPHHDTKVYVGAIFSVRREVVLKYPKLIYERLLEEMSHDNAPEAAHFMERTWSKMFVKYQSDDAP